MARMTRRKKLIAERIDRDKAYEIDDAISTLAELTTKKFRESIDVSVNLGVDPRKSDQVVRGATTLPHGTGNETRVAVFTQGANVDKAKEAGADIVGMEELADQVKAGQLDFDVVIATPDAMRIVGQLGKILGPRGLMPNPKTGTVTPDVETAVRNAKAGQVQFRTDRAGIIHGAIGKVDFDPSAVKENLEALLADLRKAKPSSSKGVYIRKVTLSTTMGPGLTINHQNLEF